MKRCSKCATQKPTTEFHKRSRSLDGLNDWCKPCKSASDADHYQRNRETIKERARERYWEDPEAHREAGRQYAAEHRDEASARARQWYAENPERARAYHREYREQHPDANVEWNAANPGYHRQWKQENRDKVLSYSANRRAHKRENWVEDVDRTTVFERDHGLCGICGLAVDPDAWDLEHIIPFKRGGMHSYANTRVSHPCCNGWKGMRLDSELPPIPPRILKAAQAEAALAAA